MKYPTDLMQKNAKRYYVNAYLKEKEANFETLLLCHATTLQVVLFVDTFLTWKPTYVIDKVSLKTHHQ